MVNVALDLGLSTVLTRPVMARLKRIRVQVGRDIARRTWIRVVAPHPPTRSPFSRIVNGMPARRNLMPIQIPPKPAPMIVTALRGSVVAVMRPPRWRDAVIVPSVRCGQDRLKREARRCAPGRRAGGSPATARHPGLTWGRSCSFREDQAAASVACLGTGVPNTARVTVAGLIIEVVLRAKSLGRERRKTFFHAEATCLGRGPLT